MSPYSPPDTEAIMAKLFQLALAVNTPSTPFKIMNRRMRHFNDVGPDLWPAFFQFQAPGIETNGGERGLPRQKLRVFWICYLPVSQNIDDVVSPAMNRYYDALRNAVLPTNIHVVPGASRNTLGGLVTNCYVDGRGIMDEGLLQTPSLIILPITITTGV